MKTRKKINNFCRSGVKIANKIISAWKMSDKSNGTSVVHRTKLYVDLQSRFIIGFLIFHTKRCVLTVYLIKYIEIMSLLWHTNALECTQVVFDIKKIVCRLKLVSLAKMIDFQTKIHNSVVVN